MHSQHHRKQRNKHQRRYTKYRRAFPRSRGEICVLAGKMMFSKSDAEVFARELRREQHSNHHPYSCRHCSWFHVGPVSNDVEEGTDMYFNIPDLIASLVANRSSLDHPTIPDGVMDMSNLIKRLLPLTHDGRALRSDVDYGIADFVARLLENAASDKDGHARPEEVALSLVLVLLLLGQVVCDRYGDTSLEELVIDALNQDVLRALAREFSAVPMKLDHDGRPIPILSMLDIFFTSRPITTQMRDGYVQRRKLPYITDEPFESTQSQEHDFEIIDLTRPSGKCNLSDFDNLIADSCNGFDDYEDFYFENQDRYHDDE